MDSKPLTNHPDSPALLSVRKLIVGIVVILVLGPLLSGAYWALNLFEDSLEKDRIIALENAVGEAVDNVRFVERRSITSAAVLASHFIIEEFSRTSNASNPSDLGSRDQLLSIALGVFEDFRQVHFDHRVIALLDVRGRVDAAKGSEREIQGLLNTERRAALTEKSQLIEWLPCPHEPSPCLLIANPVFDQRSGKQGISGYLAILVSSENLKHLGKRFESNFGGSLIITDDEGRNWFGAQSAASFPLSESSASNRTSGTGTPLRQLSAKANQNLWIVGSLPLNWQSSSEQFLNGLWLIAVIGVITCVVIILLAMQHFIFKPLLELKGSADAMASGNLQATIPDLRNDEIGKLAQALQDMQQRVLNSNTQIRELAFTDALTGLENRAMFTQLLDFTLSRSVDTDDCHALIFLDIDKFKQVNDSLSHSIGDELIVLFARRLMDILSGSTNDQPRWLEYELARFGGDEFQILLSGIGSSELAGDIAQSIQENLREPFQVGEHVIYAPASIGVAVFPNDGETTENLIKSADMAMYHAKKTGGNNFKFYSAELNERASGKLEMQVRLREAIRNDGLSLNFQPKIDLSNGKISSAEVLCRWTDEKLGNVPPDLFVKVAESHGMIGELTAWVLENACKQLAAWSAIAGPEFKLAINASSQDVHSGRLPELLKQACERHGISPSQIVIELTETGLISSRENSIENLHVLKGTGTQISLDDFGTGYSSLSYLRELPIDELKLDRSFLLGVHEDQRLQQIVKVVAELANALDLQWTAEGVEDEVQLKFLQNFGCDYAQGYMFSKPLPAKAFRKLLGDDVKLPWASRWQSRRKAARKIA